MRTSSFPVYFVEVLTATSRILAAETNKMDKMPVEGAMADSGTFIPRDRLLLVSVAKTWKKLGVYDAARYAWRVDRRRVENVDLVLACVKGIVKGVFIPSAWLDASPGEASRRNFPGFTWTHHGQRWGFVGRPASDESRKRYEDKKVPDSLAIGQSGIRYHDEISGAAARSK
jgi:hypothetical protein